MLHSNFAAVVEQPVSYSCFPVFCHPLGVLVPADLGLHTFFFVFMQTPVERDSPRVECAELPCPWCCVSLSIDAGLGLLPLLCHLCGSTCCCSTWSSPLWLFREKDTPLYFQRPLVLCGFAQKLKFYSKAWNLCSRVQGSSWPQSSLAHISRATGAVWSTAVSHSWISWLQ